MLSASSSSGCRAALAARRHIARRVVAAQQARPASRLAARRAIEEKRDTSGSSASASPDMLSQEQLQKLAELRRQRENANAPPTSSNIFQGAIQEAQLISWPTPGKALLDTVLVLAIVAATGTLLFSLNVLLADAAAWWYGH